MIWEIVKKELREGIASLKIPLLFVFSIVLVSLSFAIQIPDYEKRLSRSASTEGKEQRVPPNSLSILVKGMEVADEHRANILFAEYEAVDLSFVVRTIMSLVAILIGCSLVCEEKERGTLRLMLAGPLPRDNVILGKIMANYLALAVPFVIAVILGLLSMMLHRDISLRGEDWLRIGSIVFVSLLYILVFMNLGVFISSRTHRMPVSMGVGFMAWVILVFALPYSLKAISQQMVKVPTVDEIGAEIRTIVFQTAKRGPGGGSIQFGGEEAVKKISELNNLRVRKIEKLSATFRTLSLLSPFSSYVLASSSFAKTGFENTRIRIGDPEEEKKLEMRFAESFSHCKGEVISLILFAGLFFLAGYLSFLRYDVR